MGLALLYTSAYFLSFLNPVALYFVPSFFDYVVYPSLVTVVFLFTVFLIVSSPDFNFRIKRKLVFFGTILLTVISIKSIFDAADYPWIKVVKVIIPSDFDTPVNLRLAKVALLTATIATVLGLLYINRTKLAKWRKWLSSLGYSFFFLAIYRCIVSDFVYPTVATPLLAAPDQSAPAVTRRVIWVIFDEMDYGLSLSPSSGMAAAMPNFSTLGARAVTASHAFSPGQDTTYSIPALLTGTALSGLTIHSHRQLDLLDQQRKIVRFGPGTSVFSQLPSGQQSGTILGFYHPYCKIFPKLQYCESTYMGNAGRWFDGLTFFSVGFFSIFRNVKWSMQLLPEFILFHFDHMYRISKNILSHLDETIENQHSSLDFIHLNMPHLPNVYVQRLLNQSVTNDAEAYRQNLIGADMVLGRIVKDLELHTSKQNVLLIVSSDHWLRTHSKNPAAVPFIMWKVGDKIPVVLSERISTVHTKELALDFLAGKLETQAELADALRRTNYYETWSAPDDYKF